VNAKWVEFFNKGDFAGIASLYAKDATAFPPGSGIRCRRWGGTEFGSAISWIGQRSARWRVSPAVLVVPWTKPPAKRRWEIITPEQANEAASQPIRADYRARLVTAIARGRLWLSQIETGAINGVTEIAIREDCSPRHVKMTISLAFLAPSLVKAAVEGRLPRGIGLARLIDAPAEWDQQHRMLGLAS
jgi:hypothetical protein